MPSPRYHINVFWSAEDRCFIADIPDLRYCSAHGPTPQAAFREVLIARNLWLRTLGAWKRPLPKLRYRAPAPWENKPRKPFESLTPAQRRAATKDLDLPFVANFFRPLRPSERALWLRAKRKRPTNASRA